MLSGRRGVRPEPEQGCGQHRAPNLQAAVSLSSSVFHHLEEVCNTQGWSLTIKPSGGGLYRRKKIMRHADMKTAMKCAHLRPGALIEEMGKCFG